jgi:branched-subunit amino acid aminotransferase/4-amino-4-deoxychorismate lyase
MNGIYALQLNGHAVTLTDLPVLGSVQLGHFTSMQVRNKQVLGLKLHLQRLKESSEKLFGCHLPDDKILAYLRSILTSQAACSVRISIFTQSFYEPVIREDDLHILITRSAPLAAITQPIKVKTAHFERLLPDIKYAGIISGILAFAKPARAAGFDDVLYVDAHHNISEGTVWNIGFYDGSKIILPKTPALPGITMQAFTAQCKLSGVEVIHEVVNLSDIKMFQGAFFTNSITPGGIIAQINEHVFEDDQHLLQQLLADIYAAISWDSIV